MSDGIELIYDEKTGTWKEHKPFMVVEFPTEEDWNRFQEILKFWKDNHSGEDGDNV